MGEFVSGFTCCFTLLGASKVSGENETCQGFGDLLYWDSRSILCGLVDVEVDSFRWFGNWPDLLPQQRTWKMTLLHARDVMHCVGAWHELLYTEQTCFGWRRVKFFVHVDFICNQEM